MDVALTYIIIITVRVRVRHMIKRRSDEVSEQLSLTWWRGGGLNLTACRGTVPNNLIKAFTPITGVGIHAA